MSGKIIIELRGATDDGGDVRLNALVEQLYSLRKALSYAEQRASVGGKRAPNAYRVVGLHHSRATLEIEVVAENPLNDRSGATIYEFNRRLRQIQAREVPDEVPVDELEAYGELAPKKERRIEEVVISFDAPAALRPTTVGPIQVTRKFEENVAELIGPEEVAWGTMTGRLMAVNLENRNVFHLFPRVGPRRVYCSFERSAREDVKLALDHYVEVAGRVHYRSRDMLAHRMTAVHSVVVLDREAIPVQLSELRGMAPNIADSVDSYDEDW